MDVNVAIYPGGSIARSSMRLVRLRPQGPRIRAQTAGPEISGDKICVFFCFRLKLLPILRRTVHFYFCSLRLQFICSSTLKFVPLLFCAFIV